MAIYAVREQVKNSFYRPELDCLRFLAFFAVYLTHSLPHNPELWVSHRIPRPVAAFLAAVASSGRFGVTLFFLLSAYLITALLLREKYATGTINLRAFYLRRILRIWPLYFFALVLAVCWPWVGRMPLRYIPGFLLLSGNWAQVMLGPMPSWASILWSVSIEEQFYLIWPTVVRGCSRRTLIWVATLLIVIANLSRLWISTKNLPLAVLWESTNTNLDSFGIGILCAILLNGSIPKFSRWARIALFIDGLALFVSAGTIDPEHQFPFAAFSFPVATVGSLLLFLALCGSSLKLRPLVYLGKISYGLYVYHKLALTMAGLIIGKDRFPVFWMAGLAITITLAPLSYRFLESPFLHLKERFAVIASRPV